MISLPQIYKDPPLSQVGLEGPETGGINEQVQSGSAAGNTVEVACEPCIREEGRRSGLRGGAAGPAGDRLRRNPDDAPESAGASGSNAIYQPRVGASPRTGRPAATRARPARSASPAGPRVR